MRILFGCKSTFRSKITGFINIRNIRIENHRAGSLATRYERTGKDGKIGRFLQKVADPFRKNASGVFVCNQALIHDLKFPDTLSSSYNGNRIGNIMRMELLSQEHPFVIPFFGNEINLSRDIFRENFTVGEFLFDRLYRTANSFAGYFLCKQEFIVFTKRVQDFERNGENDFILPEFVQEPEQYARNVCLTRIIPAAQHGEIADADVGFFYDAEVSYR